MILATLLDLIFPRLCLGCKASLREDRVLCSNCFERIPLHRTLFCAVCLARLPEGKKICHNDAWYIFGAATDYAPPVRELIHALKFKYVKKAHEPLATLLASYIQSLPLPELQDSIVIPIPLSRARERDRGFNQTHMIAQVIAHHLNIPLAPRVLTRTKNTTAQTNLRTTNERRENMRAAFSLSGPDFIQGKTIILIDDVRTSGATLTEAASVLKQAGAKKIFGFVVARA